MSSHDTSSGDGSTSLGEVVRRAHHSRFFFVNVGANDGMTNDYVFPFLCEYGWRGLAVEPVPERFEELARNYARFPGVVVERAAVADTPRALHVIPPAAGYERKWTKQVGTLNRDFLLRAIDNMRAYELDGPVPAGLEDAIESIEVPCVSFNALMEKHGVDHVDLLSIDAEGCDYEIFCSIDLARYRPRILIIETGDMTPVQRRDFDARLARAALIRLTRIDFLTEVFASRELTAGGSMLGRLVGGLRARLRRRPA